MPTTAQRLFVVLVLSILPVGLRGSASRAIAAEAPPSTRPVSTTQPTTRVADRLDVLEAVFRHQYGVYAPSARVRGMRYFFLALDDGADPPAELLARFRDMQPAVLPRSMVGPSPVIGVRHKQDGGRGLILEIWTVAWLDKDTAEVRGGFYEAGLAASANTYRVERRDGRWVVTNDHLDGEA